MWWSLSVTCDRSVDFSVVSFSVHCLMTWYVYNSSHNCVGNNIVVVLLVNICHIMTQRCFMLCTTFDPSFVHWKFFRYLPSCGFYGSYTMDRNNYIEIHPTQAQVAKISYHHPSKYRIVPTACWNFKKTFNSGSVNGRIACWEFIFFIKKA
jgi:hypothetical protein